MVPAPQAPNPAPAPSSVGPSSVAPSSPDVSSSAGMPAPSPGRSTPGRREHADTVTDRTARVSITRPASWATVHAADADLRTTGDGVTVTVRSRPSDNGIADETAALVARLPGSVDGVLVVGCDPWGSAGAPARLVEYHRPAPPLEAAAATDRPAVGESDGTEHGHEPHRPVPALGHRAPDRTGVFVSHLLVTTGRHRIDVVAERPLAVLDATDDVVARVLESVRVVNPAPAAAHPPRVLEDVPVPVRPTLAPFGVPVDAEALAALQGMAGRRWNPAVLRSPGGRALIDQGLVGRFGTVPSLTSAVLAPWEAGVDPVTLEQQREDGPVTRLRWWRGDAAVTVLDGTEEAGFRIGSVDDATLLALAAGRLGVTPSWTFAFATPRLPAAVLDRRVEDPTARPDLPAAVRTADPVLARFWDAPWTVSHLRVPTRPRPVTVVHAAGVGFARIGRATAEGTAIRVEASANVHRLLVRTVLAG
ncbi:hypothetical protein [Curtobacterium sp. MCBD17_028]|uniref:hypothetical protein n=1 Tax=Curtobacterium sp. MCBD17_028 TaxID=2175670 RepID=UPI0011B35B0F|nr:hypothetical protein [Curtobacterium sp. MCBD17_028]